MMNPSILIAELPTNSSSLSFVSSFFSITTSTSFVFILVKKTKIPRGDTDSHLVWITAGPVGNGTKSELMNYFYMTKFLQCYRWNVSQVPLLQWFPDILARKPCELNVCHKYK